MNRPIWNIVISFISLVAVAGIIWYLENEAEDDTDPPADIPHTALIAIDHPVTEQFFALAVAPSGEMVAIGHNGGVTILYPATTESLRPTISERCTDVAFSPDGTILYAYCHYTIHALDATSGAEIRRTTTDYLVGNLNTAGTYAAASPNTSSEWRVVDLSTFEEGAAIPIEQGRLAERIDVSPDGSFAAIDYRDRVGIYSIADEVTLPPQPAIRRANWAVSGATLITVQESSVQGLFPTADGLLIGETFDLPIAPDDLVAIGPIISTNRTIRSVVVVGEDPRWTLYRFGPAPDAATTPVSESVQSDALPFFMAAGGSSVYIVTYSQTDGYLLWRWDVTG